MLFQHGPQHKGDFPGDNFLIYIDTAEFSQTRIAIFDTCPVHIHKLWNQLVHQGHLNKKNEYDELVLKKKSKIVHSNCAKMDCLYLRCIHARTFTLLRSSKLRKRFMILSYFLNVINTICANCKITSIITHKQDLISKKNGAAVGLKTPRGPAVRPCATSRLGASVDDDFSPRDFCGGKWLDF